MVQIKGKFYASVLYYLGSDNVTKYYKFETIKHIDSKEVLDILDNYKFLGKIKNFSSYLDLKSKLDYIHKFNIESENSKFNEFDKS